jgi:hypothetical protein
MWPHGKDNGPHSVLIQTATYELTKFILFIDLDVRRVIVHYVPGIVMYISYYDFVFSLKMAVRAETC